MGRKIDDGDKMKTENCHVGSSLDDFLTEEGIFEETSSAALDKVRASQLQKSIKKINQA